MNKFMAGFTLGLIATACFFIFYNPLQKKETVYINTGSVTGVDTLVLPKTSILIEPVAAAPVTPVLPTTNDRINRDSLLAFAQTMVGTPYLYGSIDPAKGLDCSGFITHVFNHFNMVVPRSSYEFGNLGIKRMLSNCRKGDLVLFTGTDPLERTIGHMGIINETAGNNALSFIHSTSGKAFGVTITPMDNKFYQERLMGVIDLLSQQ